MALYCDGMSGIGADGSRAGGTNFSYPMCHATGFGNRRLEAEEPNVEEQQPIFEQRPQPETTDMNAEQEAGWSGELSVQERTF